MASLHRVKAGHQKGEWRIQWTVPFQRKRQTLYLGKKVDGKWAREVLTHVTELVDARNLGRAIGSTTEKWVKTRPGPLLLRKLMKLGLVRKPSADILATFVEQFKRDKSEVAKPSTMTVYGHAGRCLVAFFGANKPLREINAGDAERWRGWLSREDASCKQGKLSKATISKRCQIAQQMFRYAAKCGVIEANPFEGMKGISKQSNPERKHFVPVEVAKRVLGILPDEESRAVFAMARFGGLRIPSELQRLRWEHLDWTGNRMLIHSPKTEHHEGKGTRYVPIFAELRPYLEALKAERQPEADNEFVFRCRNQENLSTVFKKRIQRAGVEPWPKFFHNLRATRQTELTNDPRIGIDKACKWLGNSRAIASGHYLMVTQADNDYAAGVATSEAKQSAPQPCVKEGDLCVTPENRLAEMLGNTVIYAQASGI